MNETRKKEHDRLNAVLNLLVNDKAKCNCTNYDSMIAETQRLIAEIEHGKEVKTTTDAIVEDLMDGVEGIEQGTTDVDNTTEQPTKKTRGRKKTVEEVAVD